MSASKKLSVLSCAVLLAAPSAQAVLTIYGAPGYSYAVGGYRGALTSTIPSQVSLSAASPGSPSSGLVIANENLFPPNATTGSVGRGLVVNPLAVGGATVLNQLSTATTPATNAYSTVAISPDGSFIVGNGSISASNSGVTVWKPDGTNFGLPVPAAGNLVARGINNNGTAIGGIAATTSHYVYYNSGTSYTTTAQLTAIQSGGNALLSAITTAGVVAGSSVASTGFTFNNNVATYWNAGNAFSTATVPGTALQDPAVLPSGVSLFRTDGVSGKTSSAAVVSPNGVLIGSVNLYPTGSNISTFVATRWNSTSSPAELLGLPANDPTLGAYTSNSTLVVNNNADVGGTSTIAGKIARATVWKSGTTTPTLLNNIGTPFTNPGNVIVPASGQNISYSVRGINDAGYATGYAVNSVNSGNPIDALIWDPSGNVTELNSLVTLATQLTGAGTPNAGQNATIAGAAFTNLPTYAGDGWVSLVGAYSITNDGWISGVGVYYDDDAAGFNPASGNPAPMSTYGLGTYYRAFTLQVPEAIPEPGSLALFSLGSLALMRRQKARVG